jgi:DNA polymerase
MAEFLDHQRIVAGELVAWHLSVGVDAILDDVPHDRFQETVREFASPAETPRHLIERSQRGSTPASSRPIGVASPVVAPNPADDWVREARALASAAQSLDELRNMLASFEGCALSRTAKSLILANSVAEGGIMVIGDAPEADDDRNGEAFLGRPGAMLDAMLKAIGLGRNEMALTTAIPWRPPGNRAATAQELDVCAPFLTRQIELLKPRIVLALGALPVQLLAGRGENILKLRGQWFELAMNGRSVKMMASLSPAYLLRQPLQKRFAWRDLKAFRQALSENEEI